MFGIDRHDSPVTQCTLKFTLVLNDLIFFELDVLPYLRCRVTGTAIAVNLKW